MLQSKIKIRLAVRDLAKTIMPATHTKNLSREAHDNFYASAIAATSMRRQLPRQIPNKIDLFPWYTV